MYVDLGLSWNGIAQDIRRIGSSLIGVLCLVFSWVAVVCH